MRVSNSMLTANYLNNLNKNLQKMMKQQTQISTNKRITKLSDDPVGAVSSMSASVKLERIEQYQKNITSADSMVALNESAVMELNDVLTSAYESAVSSSNDYITKDDKASIAATINQLKEHVVDLGNSKWGDKYLFGGFNTINKPFKVDDSTGEIMFNGVSMSNPSDPALVAEGNQVVEYEVAFNMKLDVSVNGVDLMGTGDENIYKILDDFYNALSSDADAEVLTEFTDRLKGAQDRLMNVEIGIGGVTNRLELLSTRHEEDYLNYTEMKSKIEDVDLSEAIMNYKMSESVYNASLQISSDIILPTLVDYIK